ncbi:baseplate J/gp47 family protein [Octadecabacter sp. G9-8]|uniref:Baseplate J/gp47 family protein n=1 Tax=Octadecabacter dasysiphoniae TaxID=2909341 RepID=A0ABS9D042_9RHOB|nr:baseplate J/gp47 family protein [Octadecabacter dasysiphoniae]MCF2872546.1 baseplate J/gp47 family protein [Octadecabacter dasysiphoniae]
MTNSIQQDLAEIAAIDAAQLLDTGSDVYGLQPGGFVPKPYGRIVAEQLALAQRLFGSDVDLAAGSVIRRICELTSAEHARTYQTLSGINDDQTVPTARGQGLDRLGEELGLPRPFLSASGDVTLTLVGALPGGRDSLTIPVGARMLTKGGHHVATTKSVSLSANQPSQTVTVMAFFPGPEHNLSIADSNQIITTWNALDDALGAVESVMTIREDKTLEEVVEISHSVDLRGGDLRWSDDRYRQLLLRAPRSVWSREAIEIAVSLVPGVRKTKTIDEFGGLDIEKSIFGNFNFGERVFGTERDIASPYMFTILVAPTASAIWQGPDGLAAQIAEAVEDLRPIGIFPEIREAAQIGVGIECELVVDGVPLPSGSRATVNGSAPARALKARLIERVQSYIDALPFGEAVSPAKISWLLMNEPGLADVRDLRLTRYPVSAGEIDFDQAQQSGAVQRLACGESLRTGKDQIAIFADDPNDLVIV